MTEKKYYTNQKDLDRLNLKSAESTKRCGHCDIDLPRTYRQQKEWIEGRQIERRPLCTSCSKRDRDLLAAVLECIRLYGGMVSLLEIIDLYDEAENAQGMFFDPFKKVRLKYDDTQALKLKDLEAWVNEGILVSEGDEQISLPVNQLRETIQKNQPAKSNPNSVQSFPTKSSPENHSDSLTRKREQGGASTGKHRWQELRNKK